MDYYFDLKLCFFDKLLLMGRKLMRILFRDFSDSTGLNRSTGKQVVSEAMAIDIVVLNVPSSKDDEEAKVI